MLADFVGAPSMANRVSASGLDRLRNLVPDQLGVGIDVFLQVPLEVFMGVTDSLPTPGGYATHYKVTLNLIHI